MSTADQLVELMFSWIKQREDCAEELKKLAEELESLRERCNVTECVGSSVAVPGSVALVGAGVATLVTGGLAAPLLGVAAVCSGAGVAVSVGTKITEHFMPSEHMEEAQKIENESKEIADKIQHQFEQLKEEVRRLNPSADPEKVKGLVMSQFVGAIARQNSRECQFDFGKFYAEMPYLLNVGLGNIFKPERLDKLWEILSFFTLSLSDKEVKLVLTKGAKQLTKNMSKIGGKTALKGSAMVVGGAVGLALELQEMIDNWKDLIKNNHVTKASQSLRDTAEGILKTTRTLRDQFDNIKQELQTMAELKSCIDDSNRSPEERKKLTEFAITKCENEAVKQWLRENQESEIFFKLVDLFKLLTQRLAGKKKKKNLRGTINIIFVAHGDIEESIIPASCLLPLPSIEDVLLYSPWNCAIDANVAYGIATGNIEPEDRKFICARNGCSIPHDLHQPMDLPDHWNSLKEAGGQKIPNIFIQTLKKPRDGAWKELKFLKIKFGRPWWNRVVVPFILPDVDSLRVPFSVVTFALSLVLSFSGFEATVHLAACLGKKSENTKLVESSLKEQYACTIDETRLKGSKKTFFRRYRGLYRALKAVFG